MGATQNKRRDRFMAKSGYSIMEHTLTNNMQNSALPLSESDLIAAIIPHPLVLSPDTPVIKAIDRMSGVRSVCNVVRDTSSLDELHAQARSSCVAIVENNRLIGILTERDIVRLCAERRDLENLVLRDVMSTDVITIAEANLGDIFNILNLLRFHRIRHLPVIDDRERLAGMLTHEILQRTVYPVELLRLRPVSEVMTTTVICAVADTSLLEIAKLMAWHRVSSVVIVESCVDEDRSIWQKTLGMITERDLVQFKALNLNLEIYPARAVMSTPVFTVEPTDSLWLVQQIIEGQSVQRLVVTGVRGQLLGIVTQTTLLQALAPVELYSLAQRLEIKLSRLEAEKKELLSQPNSHLERQVEERTDRINDKAEKYRLLNNISAQIHASSNVTEILDLGTRGVQPLLSCDFVNVWKLLGDGQTFEVVSDWHQILLVDPTISLSSSQILAPDFVTDCLDEVRVISDIHTTQISDFLRDALAGLNIRATLLVPILIDTDGVKSLWGFLSASDRDRPRIWKDEEINLLQQLATQMAIAIHQANAYEQLQKLNTELELRVTQHNIELQKSQQFLQKQADREAVLRQITQKIRKSLDLKTIFETAVREIRQSMGIDRVAIFKFDPYCEFYSGEFVAESLGSYNSSILGVKIKNSDLSKNLTRFQAKYNRGTEILYSNDLLDCEQLALEKFQIGASLILPLIDGTTLWGLLCIYHGDSNYLCKENEITFLGQIAEQIAVGIQQATLYEKIQLELDIRWRAESSILFQLKQQQILANISKNIRNSLKIEEILKTATTEIKELMIVDRVSVFRVFADRQIIAVEELVSPEYPKLLDRDWSNEYLGQEEFEFYFHGCPNIVIDVTQNSQLPHLQEYTQAICVKSKIVAPILLPSQDGRSCREDRSSDECQLWGLLSIHSCGTQRYWQDTEAQLLQEIADRLASAIQQASLFEKIQQELNERQQAEIRAIESNDRLAISNHELARATRLKDEFLASMSHELRTPLNAILGITEGFQEGTFGVPNERQCKALATIEKSGKHLLALINDILDLSKIEANKLNLEFVDVSIQSLCYNSTLFIKELAHKRDISLTTKIPDELKQIQLRVDDLRFRQILINLLSNAVKFTPEGGRITMDVHLIDSGESIRGCMDESSLSQSTSSRQIAFSVIDTGIGIAPENINKLFQSFVQIDSRLSRQYAGTGLGLSLAKRIAQMHGGNITVESEVDRGSCFTLLLPFSPITPQIPAVATTNLNAASVTRSQHKGKIAIVEDNEANMETTSSYLMSRGYEIVEATNGLQAVNLAMNDRPDIILMDIQMPGMDGLETIGRIRQIPECEGLPIVALTALAMPNDRQKCLDAGADRYLTKPVMLSKLVVTIDELLASRQDSSDLN
jgi:signal transduction histidine kinase/CBS domain-containing protein/ActR/RegA family two-component response regulator